MEKGGHGLDLPSGSERTWPGRPDSPQRSCFLREVLAHVFCAPVLCCGYLSMFFTFKFEASFGTIFASFTSFKDVRAQVYANRGSGIKHAEAVLIPICCVLSLTNFSFMFFPFAHSSTWSMICLYPLFRLLAWRRMTRAPSWQASAWSALQRECDLMHSIFEGK